MQARSNLMWRFFKSGRQLLDQWGIRVPESLKAQLRQRFGAAVAEVDGHDTWQRATLVCALVGGSEVGGRADELERFVEARLPDGCAFERDVRSLADLRD